ncbi:acyltransferase family protein [Paenibacillus allorhizosphaerae]|uniref:O-acetyltransferase OatA n=1 Tax=Paenibacillus allorhizosphaerae TaxID=2849866 RepID=A0ABM8VAM9_9BACL|nr:acyltransferase family protein [Paenibacillus allorhizosphaerae]CAG7616934.1 O-acetyltransferase OatA [Paenibacillus allorhizosphaerae]
MSKAQDVHAGAANSRYMPGLDGLRALSVLVVIAYHLHPSWAPGGFLGVGIFFTLSGYLITDQLIGQWRSNRRIDLIDFWVRRMRRLMPAMLFMLAVVGVWLLWVDRTRLAALQGDFISATLYFNNWWLIFHHVSYFESFGPPSPIGHLWSLAIEEQFYIAWPLVLALFLRFVPQRGKLILCMLIGAAVSAVAMAVIYVPGNDPSRVYYGTDTRASALIVGAVAAVVWPSRRLSETLSPRSRSVLDFIGGAGLIGLLWMIWTVSEYNDFLYRGGLALFALLSAVVTAVLAHPASFFAKAMGSKPLRWIGKRSYSLYLWHFPVLILTSPAVNTDGLNGNRAIFQLALTFLLAAASWQLIEEPVRRGSWASHGRNLRSRPEFKPRYVLLSSAFGLSLFLISCSGSLIAEQPSAEQWSIADEAPKKAKAESPSGTVAAEEPSANLSASQASEDKKPAANLGRSEEVAETSKGITAIGDSVILDAAPHLEKLMPGIIIDGKVGRQMSQAQEVVNRLKTNGTLGDRVIIELGTNGAFSKKQLRQLLTSLKEVKQIVLVNTRVPRKWQGTVNATLEEVAAEFPNAKIGDWYAASMGKDSFFAADGVHLTLEGSKFYAALVSEAVLQ